MNKITALVILLALALPGALLAADVELSADILSAYADRGTVENDEPVFQPSLDICAPFGFGFNIWANMNLTDNLDSCYPDTAGKWSEVDLELNWTLPWEGPVALTVGAIYLIYPQEGSDFILDDETGGLAYDKDGYPLLTETPADDGYELYLKLTAQDLPLAPSITFSHGLSNTHDWILLLGLEHTLDLADRLSLDLGAEVGFAGKYYIEDNYDSAAGSAWTHIQLDAALNYELTETHTVGLKAAVSTLLDNDVRDDIKDSRLYPHRDIFFGGLTASYSF